MLLTDLNEDELILIFKCCSELDHRNIAKACKFFEDIIEKHFNEKKCRNLLMVSHLKNHPEIFDRTLKGFMQFSERLRVHQNWMFGSCQQVVFFQHRENYATHLEMDQDNLYIASLGEFKIYKRSRSEGIKVEPVFAAGSQNDSVVTSLKRRGRMVAGSRSNGSLFAYTDLDGYNMEFVCDGSDPIVDFDFHEDVFVTTTGSNVRFHRLGMELELLSFDAIDTKSDLKLHSVNFNPSGESILGTTGNNFYIINPDSGKVLSNFSNSCQIYNTKWISESSFLYTSWNHTLGFIDCRTNFKRQEFSCGNFTATSVDHDGRYGVIYGTLLGMMILCDLRNTRIFERVFHLDAPVVCKKIVSDERHLFVSTNNAIHLLNFT